MIPGEYILSDGPILANESRRTARMAVTNSGDRPIQVGSHAHIFEANKALVFARPDAYGMHLNIPAGTSVRFEPGETIEVELVEYGGTRNVWGFSGLVNGDLEERREEAMRRARESGFGGMAHDT